MRRIDIINSMNKVRGIIIDLKLDVVMSPSTGSSDDKDPKLVFSTFQKFTSLYQHFSATDIEILERLNLGFLNDPLIWASLASREQAYKNEEPYKYYRLIRNSIDYLPIITELLKQDNLVYDNVSQNNNELTETADSSNRVIVTVILPEDSNSVSNPDRLIKVLESVNLLYKIYSVLYDNPENGLSVVAIDSGSDKSFDFMGLAKTMQALKECIIAIWDRIFYHKEYKMKQRLELVAQSLPLMTQIAKMAEDQTLSAEQAEILKRNLVTATDNFINAGAILPEFSQQLQQDPRQLMAPEPSLLEYKNWDINFPEGSEVAQEKFPKKPKSQPSKKGNTSVKKKAVIKRIKK